MEAITSGSAPVFLYQRFGLKAITYQPTYQLEGTVQTDGYSGYYFLDHIKAIRYIGCWAHARRKFTDVTKVLGKKRKAGAADKALIYIRKLYAIEKKIRDGNYSSEEIYEIRQAESKPILARIFHWSIRYTWFSSFNTVLWPAAFILPHGKP